MSAAPQELSGDPGYLKLPRGKPYAGYDAAKDGPLFNYRDLPSRVGPVGMILFLLIYDRTWSALGSPEWAAITLLEFCRCIGNKTDRSIRNTLEFLVDIRLIERDLKHPWRFKTHPENVATAPLLMPVRHPNAKEKKRQARAAKMSAHAVTPAFRNGPGVHEAVPQTAESGYTGPTGAWDLTAGPTVQSVEIDSVTPVVRAGESPADLKPVSSCDEGESSKMCRRV